MGDSRWSLALVQDNRSADQSPNFYETHHSRQDRVWRDFYYATTRVLLEEADQLWRSADLELAHPTGYDWPDDLLPTLLESIGHLADDCNLALRRIHLSCLHTLTEDDVEAAMRRLNAEQLKPNPPAHRPLKAGRVQPEDHGGPAAPWASVFRIDLSADG